MPLQSAAVAFLHHRLQLETLGKIYVETTQGLWKVKIADRLRTGVNIWRSDSYGVNFLFFFPLSLFNLSVLTWGLSWLWNYVADVGSQKEENPHVSGHGAWRSGCANLRRWNELPHPLPPRPCPRLWPHCRPHLPGRHEYLKKGARAFQTATFLLPLLSLLCPE